MDALIDKEYGDPIGVDYFRPTFCNRNDVLLYVNGAEH